MRLLYYRAATKNFGDDLNKSLWETLAPDLFRRAPQIGFLGIGTIIGKKFDNVEALHIFSSGAGYDGLNDLPENRRVWCVRGPITAGLIGADEDAALTDGAILCPLIFPKPGTPHRQTIVVPHWQTLMDTESDWQKACALAGYRLVSPMQDVATVLAEIGGAAHVLTESLHGAILADAYGIPWTAWTCSGNFSILKWADWTRSMRVPLEVNTIAPPSGKPLLKYGLPKFSTAGEAFTATDQILEQEIACHITNDSDTPERPLQAGSSVKQQIKRVLLSSPLDRVIAQLSARRTARHLNAIANDRPHYLSKEGTRRTLVSQMLERFISLCREQGAGDNLHPAITNHHLQT